MFHWNKKIYMDEKVKKNPKKYKKIIEKKKLVRSFYLLTLPLNDKNSLDIYSSREFWFQYYHEQGMNIVGMAVSLEAAEELLCQIVSDVYLEYKDVDAKRIHQFFKEN